MFLFKNTGDAKALVGMKIFEIIKIFNFIGIRLKKIRQFEYLRHLFHEFSFCKSFVIITFRKILTHKDSKTCAKYILKNKNDIKYRDIF